MVAIITKNENNFVNKTTQSASTTEQLEAFIIRYMKSTIPIIHPTTGIKEIIETTKMIAAIILNSTFTKLKIVASQIHKVDTRTSIANTIAKAPIFTPCQF